jgi:hypothetical protein
LSCSMVREVIENPAQLYQLRHSYKLQVSSYKHFKP